jgi:hypothetical protein
VSDDFRIRIKPVEVELCLNEGQLLRGQVFLHDGAGLMGNETLLGLLNDRAPFFPVRLHDPESTTLLVAKAQVRYMLVPSLGDDERVAAERVAAMRLEVVIQLGARETLQGILFALLPPGKRRTLDFLNAPGEPFFALVMEGRDCLVHRAYVQSVRDHNPAIDAPLPE